VPELPEVEGYRTLAESRAVGRVVASVDAADAWYLKRGLDPQTLSSALTGRRVMSARRRGKLMLLDLDDTTVLGIHFGMSGRLLVDGVPTEGRLLYAPTADAGRYERFGIRFADGGTLAVRDPRRLGGVELDPDEERLGPDALTLTLSELRRALAGSHMPLKARLLDQSRLAGVGNLIADEVLWRAGLAPGRPAASLTPQELRRLHRHLSRGLRDLIERGGSHMGDLQDQRRPGGICPRDGTPLVRQTVGGRTTFWCPSHQR
jgi:formamidopyrimidine-DNA glycosylase